MRWTCWTGWIGTACVAAVCLIDPAAVGQDAKTLEELKRWHDRLNRPNEAVSVEDGRRAQEQLKAWKLPLEKLTPEQRGEALRLEIYAALAVGDAARAGDFLPDLKHEFPVQLGTLHAAWAVAGASGDGQLAQETLTTLKDQKAATEKALATRAARLAMVGHGAPDVSVTPDGATSFRLQEREGVIFVLDFWQTSEPPVEKHVNALRTLQQLYETEAKVLILGVNMDPPESVDAARKLAVERHLKWPQIYGEAGGSPLLAKGLKVGGAPWTVLVDAGGNVRWVGAANEPEFQYALRAAVAEAKGEFAVVHPKTIDGVTLKGQKPAIADAAPEHKDQPAASSDLPHNAEAGRMLDQARVYLKTGRKRDAKALLQEIVDKYPGTWEAKDAKERLESL